MEKYHGVIPVATVLLLCSIGLVLSRQFPDLVEHLACSRENLLRMRLHTLITYAAWPFSCEHLVHVVISLLLSTYFIGGYLTQRFIWLLILGSAVLGALLFCLIVKPPAMLVGSAMISWGFLGAVLALGVRKWRLIGVIRRVQVVLVVLCTTGLVLDFTSMAAVQLVVAAAAFSTIYPGSTTPSQPPQATAAS